MSSLPQDPHNMLLDRPRLLLEDEGAAGSIGRFCFYTVLSALGVFSGFECFLTAFSVPADPVLTGLMAVVFSAFAVWRRIDACKKRRFLSLLGWILWGLMLALFFSSALYGGAKLINSMLNAYGNKLNCDLPIILLPPSTSRIADENIECLISVGFLMFPFCWELTGMMVRRHSFMGPFAMTGLLLALPMSFSIIPAGWAFGALLLFWCALLMLAGVLGGGEKSQRLDSRGVSYRAFGSAWSSPPALLLLPVLAACMLGIYLCCPPDTYERPALINDLRGALQSSLGSVPYTRGGQSNSNKQVNLLSLGSRSYTGETMLRVRFDWNNTGSSYTGGSLPQNMQKEYLKCFVGCKYTGSSWERLDPATGQQLDDIGFHPQKQIGEYRRLLSSSGIDLGESYLLSIENVGANPRCIYTPCVLNSSDAHMDSQNLEYADDGFVKSGNFLTGNRSYKLQGVGQPSGQFYFNRIYYHIKSIEDNTVFFDRFTSYTEGDKIVTASSPSISYENMIKSIRSQEEERGLSAPSSFDLWKLIPHYSDTFTQEQLDFLNSVEAYNDFVYQQYTQVPPQMQNFLLDFMEAFGLGSPASTTYYSSIQGMHPAVQFTNQIASMFQRYFTYSLDPPQPSSSDDFIEFFLESSHEGFCVHFASAAVMLLRAAGFPARYAEGYVVPSAQSGWVDVPDYNAHAWVEVYFGGVGWLPLEVTPPAQDNPAVYYDATIPQEPEAFISTPVPQEEIPTLPPRDQPTTEDDPSPLASLQPAASPSSLGHPLQSSPSGSRPQDTASPLPIILGAAGILLLAALLLLLSRALRRKKLAYAMSQPDRSQAALAAYAYLLKLYEWYARCGGQGEPPAQWLQLAEKARYGPSMLSQEELSQLTCAAGALKEKLRRQLPKLQKLRCWLLGLI